MFDLKVTVNGIEYEKKIDPNIRLLDFIRNDLGLTGTKEGCSEGECGACTVIVNGKAVDSCLMFAVQCHDKIIETIEGVGREDNMHPIQQSFLDNGAVQCGFCIPGMVLSAKALLDSNPDASEDDIKECVSGNLCRCTGYDKIFKAIKDAQSVYRREVSDNE